MVGFDVCGPVWFTVLDGTVPMVAYCEKFDGTHTICRIRAPCRFSMRAVSEIRALHEWAVVCIQLEKPVLSLWVSRVTSLALP